MGEHVDQQEQAQGVELPPLAGGSSDQAEVSGLEGLSLKEQTAMVDPMGGLYARQQEQMVPGLGGGALDNLANAWAPPSVTKSESKPVKAIFVAYVGDIKDGVAYIKVDDSTALNHIQENIESLHFVFEDPAGAQHGRVFADNIAYKNFDSSVVVPPDPGEFDAKFWLEVSAGTFGMNVGTKVFIVASTDQPHIKKMLAEEGVLTIEGDNPDDLAKSTKKHVAHNVKLEIQAVTAGAGGLGAVVAGGKGKANSGQETEDDVLAEIKSLMKSAGISMSQIDPTNIKNVNGLAGLRLLRHYLKNGAPKKELVDLGYQLSRYPIQGIEACITNNKSIEDALTQVMLAEDTCVDAPLIQVSDYADGRPVVGKQEAVYVYEEGWATSEAVSRLADRDDNPLIVYVVCDADALRMGDRKDGLLKVGKTTVSAIENGQSIDRYHSSRNYTHRKSVIVYLQPFKRFPKDKEHAAEDTVRANLEDELMTQHGAERHEVLPWDNTKMLNPATGKMERRLGRPGQGQPGKNFGYVYVDAKGNKYSQYEVSQSPKLMKLKKAKKLKKLTIKKKTKSGGTKVESVRQYRWEFGGNEVLYDELNQVEVSSRNTQ